MASIQLAAYRGISDVMTTELNALGSSTGKVLSPAIDNSANLDLFDDLELRVAFAVAPTVDTVIECYLLPSVDDTNYPEGSSSLLPSPTYYVGGFLVKAITTAQTMVLRGIALPPGFYKYHLQNTTNKAFPATGSTLRRNPYQFKSL
jgi:hypothetical protein